MLTIGEVIKSNTIRQDKDKNKDINHKPYEIYSVHLKILMFILTLILIIGLKIVLVLKVNYCDACEDGGLRMLEVIDF